MRGWAVARLLAAGLFLFSGAANAQETPGASCAGVTANAEVCHDSYCVKCISNVWTLQALRTGASSATCDSTISGTIRLNGTALEYCNATSWVSTGGAVSADSLDFTEFKDAMALDASTSITADNAEVLSIVNTGTGNSFLVEDQGSDTTPFVIDASGNVGIGTDSPVQKLHVHEAVESEIRLTNSTTGSTASDGFAVTAAEEGDAVLWNLENTSLVFATNDTERVRILGNGNVGIGTTSPATTLDVAGDVIVHGVVKLHDVNGDDSNRLMVYDWDGNFVVANTGSDYDWDNTLFYLENNGTANFYGDYIQLSPSSTTAQYQGIALNSRYAGGTGVSFIDARRPSYNPDSHIFFVHAADNSSAITLATTPAGTDTDRRAERMRITGAGNVGIGTATPAALLHVDADQGASHHALLIQNDGTDVDPGLAINDNTANDMWRHIMFEVQGSAAAAITSGGSDDSNTLYFATSLDGGYPDGNNADMVINASGNVGIGTNSPNASAILELSTTQRGLLPPRVTTTQRDAICSPAEGLTVYNTTTDALNYYTGSAWSAPGGGGAAGSDTHVQFNDGGTTLGGDSGLTYNKTTDALTAAGLVTGAGFAPTASTATGNRLYLPTTNTLGLAINGSGEVQLTGTALSPVTNDGNALGTTALKWSDLHLASGAVINFNNGDVTVTHSANTLAFAGASSGYTFDTNVSAVTVTVTSDRRYKTNIEPLAAGALEIVDKLKPVSYELKDSKEQVRHIGFIAQDVEEILPQLVETQDNAEKKKGLRYDEFIPVLTKAIQELKAQNDNLKAANEELVARLAKLEAVATKAE